MEPAPREAEAVAAEGDHFRPLDPAGEARVQQALHDWATSPGGRRVLGEIARLIEQDKRRARR